MHFSTIVSLALAGAAVAAPAEPRLYTEEEAHAIVKRQYPVKACSHLTGGIHVIATGGGNTNNEKDYGLLGSLATNILNTIPGSTNVSMPYNKNFLPGSSPPKLYPGAVSDGMTLLKAYTVQYHNACPHTKIALLGYSSGGVITMNDVCHGGNGVNSPQINPLIANNIIIATVVYGEETRVGGQSYNVGTCPSQYSASAPRANPGLCAPFADGIQSYCDIGDPDCCVGSPGADVNIHLSYPSKYDGQATSWVQGRLAANGGA